VAQISLVVGGIVSQEQAINIAAAVLNQSVGNIKKSVLSIKKALRDQ
jgi:hypothetical protein